MACSRSWLRIRIRRGYRTVYTYPVFPKMLDFDAHCVAFHRKIFEFTVTKPFFILYCFKAVLRNRIRDPVPF
jgi:hypothetical protein